MHKGQPCDGTLDGGASLGTGTGYYQWRGSDPQDIDDWGGCESTHDTIADVGGGWYNSHPTPRMGILDISRQGGGPFAHHDCHQNGLDVDVRYVRDDGQEAPLDLRSSPDDYSQPLTLELIRLWAATGIVEWIEVDSGAGIGPADVSGAAVVVDSSGEHANHFHVRLRDPDGADTNIC